MTDNGERLDAPWRGRPGATLAAVAARVGVSRTTVSNAYNRPDQLSSELRNRILAAAAELGYSGPDPVARSLRTRQADAVGLIFAERLGYAFRDPGAVEFLHGLGEACTERGRSLLMVPAGQSAQVATVLRAAVDGFVLSSVAAADPLLAAVLSRPQPAVIVDSPRGVAGTCSNWGTAGWASLRSGAARTSRPNRCRARWLRGWPSEPIRIRCGSCG
jgi:DNA-binding LacI/PurR family transcriptional regulator